MTYRPRTATPLNAPTRPWHRWKVSTQKLAVALSVMAAISGFGYVMLTNSTAAQGFAIKKLERQITAIKAANEKLALQTTAVQTLATVKAQSAQFKLQPTESFTTLAPATGPVAVR